MHNAVVGVAQKPAEISNSQSSAVKQISVLIRTMFLQAGALHVHVSLIVSAADNEYIYCDSFSAINPGLFTPIH